MLARHYEMQHGTMKCVAPKIPRQNLAAYLWNPVVIGKVALYGVPWHYAYLRFLYLGGKGIWQTTFGQGHYASVWRTLALCLSEVPIFGGQRKAQES